MSAFSKKDQGEIIAILDVQSSVVRSSLAVVHGVSLPNIFFTYNAAVPFKAHTDSSYLIKMTLRAIDECIMACEREIRIHAANMHLPRRISAVHYALSSPWIVSEAKSISKTFDRSTRVTEGYIRETLALERSKMVPTSAVPIQVIEEKIFDVRLNGYSITDWNGKEAISLDISFTASIAGARMIEHFTSAAGRLVKSSRIFFHSSLLLQYIGIENVIHDSQNCSLLHIHGELTELAIVRGSACVFFGSFPIGTKTIMRKIAAAGGTDEHAADSLLTLHTGGHLDPMHGKGAESLIGGVVEGWLSSLKKLFAEAALPLSAPIAIIFSAFAHDDFFLKLLAETYPKARLTLLSIDEIAVHATWSARTERRRLSGLYAIAIHTMRTG